MIITLKPKITTANTKLSPTSLILLIMALWTYIRWFSWPSVDNYVIYSFHSDIYL